MAYRVLIVDDKPAWRETVQDALGGLDCFFFEVARGEDALQLLHNTTFQVLFLDLKLPGISGIEFLKQAQESRRDLGKVIVLTGFPEAHTRQQANELGVFRYLSKVSLDREEIRKAFSEAIREEANTNTKAGV